MQTSAFDNVVRAITTGVTRRSAIATMAVGATAATAGLGNLPVHDASARRKQKGKKKKKRKDQSPPAPENVCAAKNWCIDRNQVCGATGGNGKCFVESTGGNVCAEILFQAATCDDCAAPVCTNCKCVLAAGGGDRCNNGATGSDFICVREV